MTDIAPITEVVLTSDLFDDCLDVESLSPAAEAVLDAYMKGFGWLDSPTKKDGRCIAATLRAAADQIQMKELFGNTDADAGVFAAHQAIHASFFAIAAELEGQ
jgi:hypothetical protein